MARDPWAAPPTEAEIKAAQADPWAAPPTQQEAQGGGQPQQAPAAPVEPPGYPETIARGAAQGATAGFADELKGAIDASGLDAKDVAIAAITMGPAAVLGLLGKAGFNVAQQGGEETLEQYTAGRDEQRQLNAAAEEANPKTYLASQVGGGLATAAIPGAGAGSLLKAAGTGAAFGAAVGLGESEADLTTGELDEFAEAAKDTAIGGAIGAGVGGLAHGAVKGVGKVIEKVRRAPPTPKGSVKVAKDIASRADEPSLIGRNKTLMEAGEEGYEIAQDVSREIGETFRLRPSQEVGDPAAALAEKKALEFPRTMLRSQAEAAKQADQASKYFNKKIEWVARDPERLGKAKVSESLIKDIEREVTDLVSKRSKAARPYFQRFRAESADAPIALENTAAVLRDEIAGLGKGAGASAAQPLRKTLRALGEAADLGAIQAEMSVWSGLAKAHGTQLDQLGSANKRRIARTVLDALGADLDEAASGAATPGAAALKEGRRLWSEMSKPIDELGVGAIKKALKIGASDATDTVTDRLASLSPKQIEGVFKVLNKSAPETAQAWRAQMLEDALTGAGKVARGASEEVAQSAPRMVPLTALKRLAKLDPVLQSAYAGDARAVSALKDTRRLLERLAFGPNIKGSHSAHLAAQALDEAAAPIAAAAGPKGSALVRLTKRVLGSDKAVAEAMSTPEGVDAFHRVIQGIAESADGKPLRPKLVKALTRAATTLWALGDQELTK